ncbi:hypothetical protein METUNv1_03097 [Methyloversatilis universalis FAM5]|uniref:Uncharacterized protein n=1 Tax=Methyloversatilis universalis (strain ATCC BAA-1314 / DSM 25237 / JCM 13912 / CCUG 52030 / FAM5) TaxID=1000565 RepID=F5RFL6_METUF|nr:hypothetical protein METUNv1_03097 [Methyloversatilis universalis FAM5]
MSFSNIFVSSMSVLGAVFAEFCLQDEAVASDVLFTRGNPLKDFDVITIATSELHGTHYEARRGAHEDAVLAFDVLDGR